jgi:hypothetical protein
MLKPESCWEQWVSIGASHTVVDWIKFGVPLTFHAVPEAFILDNHPLSPKQERFVDCEIRQLLADGIIEKCDYTPVCISPLSCVPKKDSYR